MDHEGDPAPARRGAAAHDEHATELDETLAIEKGNDVASPVLRAGTLLPTSYSETFSTVDDGQRAVQLRLLVGASKKASECRTLLNLNVPLEHLGPRGKPKVKLVLSVGEDGSLAVHAHEQGARRPVETTPLRVAVKLSDKRRPRLWTVLRHRGLVASIKYAYFAYVVYSDIDQSGLTGWIASLSMRLFHASWDIPNVLLGWALYFPGVWLFRRGLRVAMPGVVFFPAGKPILPPRPSPPKLPLPAWIGIGTGVTMLVGFVGGLAGAIAFGAWTIDEQRRAVPFALNLDNFSGTPPGSPRVELEGWFHEQLTARYEAAFAPTRVTGFFTSGGIDGADHAYTPVTSAHWKPGEPVSFLLEDNAEAPVAARLLLGRSIHWKPGQDPASLTRQRNGDGASPPLATTRNVRLRANDLPFFVKDSYERTGIRFTDPYWVAYTDSDERPFALALVGAMLVVLVGLPFLATRLAKKVRRPRAG